MGITIPFEDLFNALKYQFKITNTQSIPPKYRSLNH